MTNNRNKILIVEDDRKVASVIGTLLENNSYQIIYAQSVREAEMLFLSHLPDAVILDLGLPDGDGVEVIDKIREAYTTPHPCSLLPRKRERQSRCTRQGRQ